jgi:signal transduction histidine kinase
LFLDDGEVHRETSADLQLRLIILASAAAAATGLYFFLRANARTRRLGTELAVAEERSRRNREWVMLGAGLAHETKNPLAVVRAAAQRLAAEGCDDPRLSETVHQIVDEVDRVVSRVNEFLCYSRPIEPTPETVELRSFLEEIGSLLEPDLKPGRGELVVEAQPTAVLADPDMLRQILLNLLVNATHAIPEGGRIELRAEHSADGTVRIEVRDNGQGIPASELERVFEPYFTRSPRGTGLGLAIVRRLVEAQGWRIDIESKVGMGTRVVICNIKVPANE